MEPNEIIKYIFAEERQDYQARLLKCRKRELIQAKQRSMYLIKHFNPHLRWEDVGAYFGQKHDGAIHAYNKVTNYIATEPKYSNEIARYITIIRGKINRGMKVKNNTVEYRMFNKRVILNKTDSGYIILLKRLVGRKVEKKYMVVSPEAMDAIINAYKILN